MRVVTHVEGAFELDELRAACDDPSLFLFMKESVRILDPDRFWSAIEAQDGPAWLFGKPSCYLGIYDPHHLWEVLHLAPTGGTKNQSIDWEAVLHDWLPYPSIWPEVTDWTAKRIEYVDGQPELVVGNDVVEKSKGTAHCGACRPGTATIPGICPEFMAMYS